jgi:bacterioferritin-associated ferredoxin
MIICSCNVLSDQDVRAAVAAERMRSTSRVYDCLGCRAKCGGCARTIRRIMDEALGSAPHPVTTAPVREGHRACEHNQEAIARNQRNRLLSPSPAT